MKVFPFLFIVILFFSSCSKKEDTNPVENEVTHASGFIQCSVKSDSWSADVCDVLKKSGSLYITGKKSNSYGSAEVMIRIINVIQPGTYGIGENEHGFNYAVKGTYTSKKADGSIEKLFTAFHKDVSFLKINSLDEKNIDANFDMFLYNDNRSDSLMISAGKIKLAY